MVSATISLISTSPNPGAVTSVRPTWGSRPTRRSFVKDAPRRTIIKAGRGAGKPSELIMDE